MSIKTSELQQLQSILGTDSLLADTAAAGTGRLSLARAAEFFGAELVKPANPVGAALSNKAALSTQNTVEATSVPTRTVEVAAADLPGYIAGLPRLLTECLTIKVSGTLTADDLEISTFYGPGSLAVSANADGDAVLKTSAKVYDCTVPVIFNNIRFQDPMPGSDIYRTGIRAGIFGIVTIINCSFSSANGGTVHQKGYTAIYANKGGIIISAGIRNISGCACAVNASDGGVVVCSAETADAMHDNSVGAIVYEGGIVYLGGASPDTLGGATNAKYTGLIVKGGALL